MNNATNNTKIRVQPIEPIDDEQEQEPVASKHYIPSMKTIGSKLRKLFSTSGQTVESALPNEIEVSPSSDESSGGAVTLYFTYDESTDAFSEAYKDIAMTESFSSNEEAVAALTTATVVKLCLVAGSDIDGIYIHIAILIQATPETVSCTCCGVSGEIFTVYVAINSSENPDPDPEETDLPALPDPTIPSTN